MLPNEASFERMVGAVPGEVDDKWASDIQVYLNHAMPRMLGCLRGIALVRGVGSSAALHPDFCRVETRAVPGMQDLAREEDLTVALLHETQGRVMASRRYGVPVAG